MNGSGMQLHDSMYDGETDAVAGGGMRFVALIEAMEYALQICLRNHFSPIADGYCQLCTLIAQTDFDFRMRIGKLDGIVQKIDPDLLEQIAVADNIEFLRVEFDSHILGLTFFIQQPNRLTQLLRHIEARLARENALTLQRGQVHDICGQFRKPPGFADDNIQIFSAFLNRQISTI